MFAAKEGKQEAFDFKKFLYQMQQPNDTVDCIFVNFRRLPPKKQQRSIRASSRGIRARWHGEEWRIEEQKLQTHPDDAAGHLPNAEATVLAMNLATIVPDNETFAVLAGKLAARVNREIL